MELSIVPNNISKIKYYYEPIFVYFINVNQDEDDDYDFMNLNKTNESEIVTEFFIQIFSVVIILNLSNFTNNFCFIMID